eukprot:4902887-Pyramimonas_sp.AAC.1
MLRTFAHVSGAASGRSCEEHGGLECLHDSGADWVRLLLVLCFRHPTVVDDRVHGPLSTDAARRIMAVIAHPMRAFIVLPVHPTANRCAVKVSDVLRLLARLALESL